MRSGATIDLEALRVVMLRKQIFKIKYSMGALERKVKGVRKFTVMFLAVLKLKFPKNQPTTVSKFQVDIGMLRHIYSLG